MLAIVALAGVLVGIPIGALLRSIAPHRHAQVPAPAPTSTPAASEWSAEHLVEGSVEVDCRACGQLVRVPLQKLRDHPRCRKCKMRLMPGKAVTIRASTICHVGPTDDYLEAYSLGPDSFWQYLADHVTPLGAWTSLPWTTPRSATDPGSREPRRSGKGRRPWT